jgi:hypothetical protein
MQLTPLLFSACRLRRSVLDGIQLILKVLVNLLKSRELALEDAHLAEDVF